MFDEIHQTQYILSCLTSNVSISAAKLAKARLRLRSFFCKPGTAMKGTISYSSARPICNGVRYEILPSPLTLYERLCDLSPAGLKGARLLCEAARPWPALLPCGLKNRSECSDMTWREPVRPRTSRSSSGRYVPVSAMFGLTPSDLSGAV